MTLKKLEMLILKKEKLQKIDLEWLFCGIELFLLFSKGLNDNHQESVTWKLVCAQMSNNVS